MITVLKASSALLLFFFLFSCKTPGSNSAAEPGSSLKEISPCENLATAHLPEHSSRWISYFFHLINMNSNKKSCYFPTKPEDPYAQIFDTRFIDSLYMANNMMYRFLTQQAINWTMEDTQLIGWVVNGNYIIKVILVGDNLKISPLPMGLFDFRIFHDRALPELKGLEEAYRLTEQALENSLATFCRASECISDDFSYFRLSQAPGVLKNNPQNFLCKRVLFPALELFDANAQGRCWPRFTNIYSPTMTKTQFGLPLPFQVP